MDRAGLKDADVAEKLGISRSYVTQIRNGRAPTLTLAIRIFRLLNVKLGPIAAATDEDIEAMERVAEKGAA